jgi:hypothetical protein
LSALRVIAGDLTSHFSSSSQFADRILVADRTQKDIAISPPEPGAECAALAIKDGDDFSEMPERQKSTDVLFGDNFVRIKPSGASARGEFRGEEGS